MTLPMNLRVREANPELFTVAQPEREVGVFNDAPISGKPPRHKVDMCLHNCITYDVPDEHRSAYQKWYGNTLFIRAMGNTFNDVHKRFRNEKQIHTSLIVKDVTYEDGSRFLYTANSIYEVLS